MQCPIHGKVISLPCDTCSVDEGGAAFPHMNPNVGLTTGNYGMSLRDYFAASVLNAMISNPWIQEKVIGKGEDHRIFNVQRYHAESAYQFADEMLKARKEKSNG